jgi:hypothetical protein
VRALVQLLGWSCLLVPFTLRAHPVVNEVLANEPGSTTGLEWIELYNADSPVCLQGYCLRIGDNLIELPSDVSLSKGEYYMICRRLFATSTSPGFESVWGDSSGEWGDTPHEDSLQMPFEAAMSLANDFGCVELLGGSTVVSSLTWVRGGLDGYSWERVCPESDSVGQSIDPGGSTPGFLNSLTPAQHDLALSGVAVSPENGTTSIGFEISNVGLQAVSSARLYLIDLSYSIPDTVDLIQAGPLETGEVINFERQYSFKTVYLPMIAILAPDDRARNNTYEFMAVGDEYPPVALSEVLANPQDGLNTEWVEVSNRSDHEVDLSGWLVGDALRMHQISTGANVVAPGERLVLVQAESDFLLFYSSFAGRCVEPGNWSSFNNDGDIVRLVDSFGIEADRFEYETLFEDNYTWCRCEDDVYPAVWGRSENAGGSPGGRNRVVSQQDIASLRVTVEPTYVSPDGDGFEDYATITIEAPVADDYTVRIYDRQGRAVRSFFDKETFVPSTIEWDGLSDAGRRLPIGIYILYVEAAGVGSIRKPVVVAR